MTKGAQWWEDTEDVWNTFKRLMWLRQRREDYIDQHRDEDSRAVFAFYRTLYDPAKEAEGWHWRRIRDGGQFYWLPEHGDDGA